MKYVERTSMARNRLLINEQPVQIAILNLTRPVVILCFRESAITTVAGRTDYTHIWCGLVNG